MNHAAEPGSLRVAIIGAGFGGGGKSFVAVPNAFSASTVLGPAPRPCMSSIVLSSSLLVSLTCFRYSAAEAWRLIRADPHRTAALAEARRFL